MYDLTTSFAWSTATPLRNIEEALLAIEQPMKYRTLGRTGVNVSVVGLGTGGQSRLGQMTHKDAGESARVVRRALELGINLIDTAPNYADTEAFLGEVLQ